MAVVVALGPRLKGLLWLVVVLLLAACRVLLTVAALFVLALWAVHVLGVAGFWVWLLWVGGVVVLTLVAVRLDPPKGFHAHVVVQLVVMLWFGAVAWPLVYVMPRFDFVCFALA